MRAGCIVVDATSLDPNDTPTPRNQAGIRHATNARNNEAVHTPASLAVWLCDFTRTGLVTISSASVAWIVAVDFKVELRIAMGVLVLRSSFFFLKLTPPNSAITSANTSAIT